MAANSFNVAMGRLVRELRKKQGLTQGDVGAVLGVSYQQVSKVEAGTNAVAACYLPKLASLFGTSVASFYERVGVADAAVEPTGAENDSFLAARYVAKITDPKLRSAVVDHARKVAYMGGAA